MRKNTTIKVINKFYGGIIRDDRSKTIGSASNIEELDIFSNADYFKAEQIMSAETLPANTEIYAYSTGDDDTVYGYGRKTDATAGTVRLVSVSSGGGDNPGSFSTLATSSDTTNLATRVGDMKFFRTVEASNPTSLYYIKGTGSSWYLVRYNIGAAEEQVWGGSSWAAGAVGANTQLTGLTGSFDRPTMKVVFGELLICQNRYIARVDKDGVFTEKAFTLPQEWQAVDIEAIGDNALILCRNRNRLANISRAFWWDLTSAEQVDDSFTLPKGGPQWIINYAEQVKILCAINGTMRMYQLSGAFEGAIPIELPNIGLENIGVETSTRPISAPKMISCKEDIIYFGLLKTDKTGIYAIGQLDHDKPHAVILSKRFNTTNYANHRPTALHIHGPNFFASYDDNGTETAMRCESNNSPSRSSNAVYESIWIDADAPFNSKKLEYVYLATKPLAASTSVTVSIASDYSASYTTQTRADGTNYTGTGLSSDTIRSTSFGDGTAYKVKLALTSNGTDSPIVQAVALDMVINNG